MIKNSTLSIKCFIMLKFQIPDYTQDYPPMVFDFINSVITDIAQAKNENKRKRRQVALVFSRDIDSTGEYSQAYGIYPEIALQICKGIIDGRRGASVSLLSLIDDWSHLKGLRKGPKIRKAYWEDVSKNYTYSNTLGMGSDLVEGLGINIPPRESSGRISEQRLHNQFTDLISEDGIKTPLKKLLRTFSYVPTLMKKATQLIVLVKSPCF